MRVHSSEALALLNRFMELTGVRDFCQYCQGKCCHGIRCGDIGNCHRKLACNSYLCKGLIDRLSLHPKLQQGMRHWELFDHDVKNATRELLLRNKGVVLYWEIYRGAPPSEEYEVVIPGEVYAILNLGDEVLLQVREAIA